MLQVADAVSAELAEACEENVHRMDGAVQVMLILLAGNQLILVAMLHRKALTLCLRWTPRLFSMDQWKPQLSDPSRQGGSGVLD